MPDVWLSDVFESRDPRDTDPKQPNNRRRVQVVGIGKGGRPVAIENMTTHRVTRVDPEYLTGRRWMKVPGAGK